MVGISKIPMLQGGADDFQTPISALDILLPYLDKKWIIWECAEGKGNLSNSLFSRGFNVIASDKIKMQFEMTQSVDTNERNSIQHYSEKDFLIWKPDNFDCIITNPPYSVKEKFLERCFELRKPFALLMPLTALESEKRQKLYRKHGIQLIIPNRRINFETPSGKGGGSWFATCWFTWGLNLPRDLNFVEVDW